MLATVEFQRYNTSDRLLSIRTGAGETQTLTYTSNRLAAVTDDFGHQLTFQWDTANSRLSGVTLPDGGQLLFTYTTNNRFYKVTYPDTRTREYWHTYSGNPQLVTLLKDEMGGTYATWGYSSGNIVTSSVHAGGVDSYSFTYDHTTGARVAVDPRGFNYNWF